MRGVAGDQRGPLGGAVVTGQRAAMIAGMCAPGAEWSAEITSTKPPVIRISGEFPDGRRATIYHEPWTLDGGVKLHECLAVSRDVLNVAEAWAGGEL